MKKLFVLFLLVALVPFTVGCSLWGHDEDLDVIAKTTKSATVKVPAAAISGVSARAAVSYTTMTLTINGIPFSISGTPVYNKTDDTYTITFVAELTESQIESISAVAVPVVITAGGNTIVSTTTSVSIDTTVPVIVVVDNGDGTIDVTVNGTTVVDNSTPPVLPKYEVASVTVLTTELNATEYKKIASLTPTFTVTLKEAYTNASLDAVKWDVKVTNKTTGLDFVLSSTNTAHKALFTVAASGDAKKAVTVKVNTKDGAQPSSLTINEDYEVTLIATDLTNGTATLDQATFRFNTGA